MKEVAMEETFTRTESYAEALSSQNKKHLDENNDTNKSKSQEHDSPIKQMLSLSAPFHQRMHHEREPSIWTQADVYFHNNGAAVFLMVVLLSILIISVSYGVRAVDGHGEAGQGTINTIGRGCGRYVTIGSAVLLITGARTFWMKLRSFAVLHRILPFNYIMPFAHKYIAWSVALAGIIHAIGQTINFIRGDASSPNLQPGLWNNKNNYMERPTIQLLVTGIMLTMAWLAIVLTARKKVRARAYRVFWLTHLTGYSTIYILLIFHGTYVGKPFSWKFLVPAFVIYGGSKILQLFKHTSDMQIHSLRLSECEGVVRMELSGMPWQFHPGQYANLLIPSINHETHSFSIACAPDNKNLVFFIAAVGAWTKELLSLAKGGPAAYEHVNVKVSGPFGAPTDNYFGFPRLLLVGSGVGATPMVSVLDHLHNLYDASSQVQSRSHIDQKWEGYMDSHFLWRKEILHSKVPIFRFINRVSTLYVQLYVLTLSVALSISLHMNDSSVAYYVTIPAEALVAIMFGTRLVGIVFRLHKLKLPWTTIWQVSQHIMITAATFLLGVGLAVFEVYLAYISDDEKERNSRRYIVIQVVLEILHIVFVLWATELALGMNWPHKRHQDPDEDEHLPPKGVRFIWIVRHESQCWWMEELLEVTKNKQIVADIYLTRQEEDELPKSISSQIRFHSGRPNFDDIIRDVYPPAYFQDPLGVFFCGSPAVGEHISEACDEYMEASHAHVYFHEEHFG
eukprot:m.30770 g.30770  ORF g.30770 m.30770 type:complete len:736 (-) comp8237_c0_seq1:27-2234(-)